MAHGGQSSNIRRLVGGQTPKQSLNFVAGGPEIKLSLAIWAIFICSLVEQYVGNFSTSPTVTPCLGFA